VSGAEVDSNLSDSMIATDRTPIARMVRTMPPTVGGRALRQQLYVDHRGERLMLARTWLPGPGEQAALQHVPDQHRDHGGYDRSDDHHEPDQAQTERASVGVEGVLNRCPPTVIARLQQCG
jgi:hypothetical protein